mmetsp:Transcript_10379/g.22741  ORF Transcript_10379/g.22741 Transcript_10379/m.22741 type:complete len:324 (-) Transcript_10379:401-1372(-)
MDLLGRLRCSRRLISIHHLAGVGPGDVALEHSESLWSRQIQGIGVEIQVLIHQLAKHKTSLCTGLGGLKGDNKVGVIQGGRIDTGDCAVGKPPGPRNVDPIVHHLSHPGSAKILTGLGPNCRHGAAEEDREAVTLQRDHRHPLVLVPGHVLLAKPLNLPVVVNLASQQISLPGRPSRAECESKPPLGASHQRRSIRRVGGGQLLRRGPVQVAVDHLADHSVPSIRVQCIPESHQGKVVVEHDGPHISCADRDLVVGRQHRVRVGRRGILGELQGTTGKSIPLEPIAALAYGLTRPRLHAISVLAALHQIATWRCLNVAQRHRQ